MSVSVEFYGIPRTRAGVATTTVEGVTLGDVLLTLGNQFPDFASDCLADGVLASGYVANLNGEQFVREPATRVGDGDSLLILSSDAGG